jgi:hypothetical protein
MGVGIMSSSDKGVTWTRHKSIYNGPSTGYTGIQDVGQNRILYTFDTLGFGWDHYNKIRVARIHLE